jgi:hypothetical protein
MWMMDTWIETRSMAHPDMIGVVALMLDKNDALTRANILDTLMATATYIGTPLKKWPR